MDAKLNHSDLSALLAKEANISCAKAEQFTKAMFDLIIEGLEKDGIVKINGLGTFKVSEVASRSSVNVNTGEKFEIKGHKKLTFTPADTLKDDVNQPFAMFEPVEVDENYVDNNDETEAEEIPTEVEETTAVETVIEEAPQVSFIPTEEEMPAEEEHPVETAVTEIIEEEQPVEEVSLQHTVHTTTTHAVEETAEEVVGEIADNAEEEEATEEVVEEAPVEENEPVACDTVEETAVTTETTVESECHDATEAEVESEANATAESVMAVEEKAEEKTEQNTVKEEMTVKRTASISTTHETVPAAPGKGNSGMKWIFSLLVVAVLATCTLFVFYGNSKNEQQTEDLVAENVQSTMIQPEEVVLKADTLETAKTDTIVTETLAEPVMVEPEVEEEYTFVMCDELAARNIKEITIADTTLYKANGEFAVHKVENGDRLTRIAMKYYGDKKLWPYIVMYNKLKDPNGLCRGMELAIPKLKVIE